MSEKMYIVFDSNEYHYDMEKLFRTESSADDYIRHGTYDASKLDYSITREEEGTDITGNKFKIYETQYYYAGNEPGLKYGPYTGRYVLQEETVCD